MKALKAFIKPLEAPQRYVKIEIQVNFYILIQLSEMDMGGGLIGVLKNFATFTRKHLLESLFNKVAGI